jgi:hypothetical protein
MTLRIKPVVSSYPLCVAAFDIYIYIYIYMLKSWLFRFIFVID